MSSIKRLSTRSVYCLGAGLGGLIGWKAVNHHHDEDSESSSRAGHNNSVPSRWQLIPDRSLTQCSPSVAASGGDSSRSSQDPGVCNRDGKNVTSRRRLARHNTVQMMQATKTLRSLESRYKVDWEFPLGEGAFGAVYEAVDRDSGETVAIKKIAKAFTDDKGFQREMNALNHVRQAGGHPNICGLRENFEEEDYYYLSLDLVSGGEMFDHLVQLGAYSEADASRLMREVARALAFLHGLNIVHGDLKPENLLLSTTNASNAVIKVVDFGASQVNAPSSTNVAPSQTCNTMAYCPPEVMDLSTLGYMDASLDMWSLGVILYIMLTGYHPFDLDGQSTDAAIMHRIVNRQSPPLRNHVLTAHLSDSSLDLIEKLMAWDSKDRLTALQMLEHPWVQGETARQDKMADSAAKLKAFRVFKSRLEATVFANIISWSQQEDGEETNKRTSLIERAFHTLDRQRKGFITTHDLHATLEKQHDMKNSNIEDGLSLSNFEDLLSDNMKNKYFPKGHLIFREGDVGDHMYFINSGTIQISTKDGTTSRRTQGDFFGEGALLNPSKTRSVSVKCVTPVHVIEVSREYFEKYLRSSEIGLTMTLREKDKTRRRNRAKQLLRLQNNMKTLKVPKEHYLYKVGEEGDRLYILEDGAVDVRVGGHTVFTVRQPGNLCGEHALVMGRVRNTAAVCVSESCRLQMMNKVDFDELLRQSESLRESLRDICLRREFLKAIVYKTKMPFPTDPKDLRRAFEAADEDSSGHISLDNVRTMLKRYDPAIEESDLLDIINSLDLDKSGVVSFEEFNRIFGIHEAKSTST